MAPHDVLEFPCPFCGRSNRVEETSIPPNGEIDCPDCGETIRMRSAPPQAPPASRAASSDTLIRIDEWDELQEAAGPGEVACPQCGHRFAPDGAAGGRPRILVVEDTEFFTHLAVDILEREHETVVVKTVAEAKRKLAEQRFDLVLLDLTLSDGAGTEVLAALPRPDLPVLLYTSRDETSLIGEEWQRLRSLGANDVIHKGLNIEESLLRKVEDLLAGAPGRV